MSGQQEIKKRLDETLERVEAFFLPGRLGDKQQEISLLRKNGDTMLFDGEVSWSIYLPGEYKRLCGSSESLDDAFADMRACLSFLGEDYDPETTDVICALESGREDGRTDA